MLTERMNSLEEFTRLRVEWYLVPVKIWTQPIAVALKKSFKPQEPTQNIINVH